MPSIHAEFPSKYLKGGQHILNEESATLTIKETRTEMVGQGDDAERKPVVYFRETEMGLVLNKTNALAISKALGNDDYLTWPGKRITIGAQPVEYSGKTTIGLRVRMTPPKADAVLGLARKPEAEASM